MTQPTTETQALIDRIVQEVAELPDRTSPDDWPEAMLVTADELRAIVNEHIASALLASETREQEFKARVMADAVKRIEQVEAQATTLKDALTEVIAECRHKAHGAKELGESVAYDAVADRLEAALQPETMIAKEPDDDGVRRGRTVPAPVVPTAGQGAAPTIRDAFRAGFNAQPDSESLSRWCFDGKMAGDIEPSAWDAWAHTVSAPPAQGPAERTELESWKEAITARIVRFRERADTAKILSMGHPSAEACAAHGYASTVLIECSDELQADLDRLLAGD